MTFIPFKDEITPESIIKPSHTLLTCELTFPELSSVKFTFGQIKVKSKFVLN